LHFSNLWCIKYYYRRDNNIDSILCLLLFFVSGVLKLFTPIDIADSDAAATVVHLHKVIIIASDIGGGSDLYPDKA